MEVALVETFFPSMKVYNFRNLYLGFSDSHKTSIEAHFDGFSQIA